MNDGTITLGIRIEADGKDAAAEVKTTTGEIDKLGASTRTASSEAERLSVSLRNQTLQMASARDAARQNSVAVTETAGSVTKLLDKYDQTGVKLRQLQADFKALDQAASSGKLSAKDDARLDSVYAKIRAEIKATQEAAAGFGPAAHAGFARATEGAEKSAFATAGARRELMVIGHEVMQGDFARIPGSMMVLAGSTGVSTSAIIGLGGAVGAAVAILGAFAFAAYQGTAENHAFNQSLVLSGNTAGTTVGELQMMSQAVATATSGTQHFAAEVLNELAAGGQVAAAGLQQAAQAAIDMERAGGPAAAETVKQFNELGKSPVEASLKLNESTHFLTESVYLQIKALQEQGNIAAAAAVAQSAYADAVESRAQSLAGSMGRLEKSWLNVKDAAKSAWDAMLNIGRPTTIDEAQAKLEKMQQAYAEYQKGNKGRLLAPSQADILAQQKYIDGLKSEAVADSARAAAKDEVNRKEQAAIQWQQHGEQYLGKTAQMWREISKAEIEGTAAGKSQAEILQRISDIQAKYADKVSSSSRAATDKYVTEMNNISKASADRTAAALAQMDSVSNLTAGEKKYAEVLARSTDGMSAAALKARDSALAQLTHEVATEKAAAAGERARKVATEWAGANAKLAQSVQQSNTSIEADIVSLQRHNEEIGLSTEQLAALTLHRMDDTIAIAEQRVEQTELTDVNADYVSSLMDQVRLLREKRGLMADGQIKQAAADQVKTEVESRKKGWEETDRNAREIFTGWGTAGEEMADKTGKALKSALMNAIYEATLRPIVFQIYSGTSSAMGSLGIGGPGGGMGGTGNLLNNGSSIYNSASSLIGSAGAYSAGVSGLSATGAGSQAAMLAAQTGEFGAAGLMSTASSGGGLMASVTPALGMVATAIPWIAAAYAIYSLVSQPAGGPKIEGNAYGLAGSSGALDVVHRADYAAPYGDGDWGRPGADAARVETVLSPAVRGISEMARRLGGSTAGVGFSLGYNSDPQGDAPDNVSSGVRGADGKWIYQNTREVERGKGAEALPGEVAKMTLATLASVDLGAVWNPLLASLGDVSKMTDAEISGTLASINSLGELTATNVERVFNESFDVNKISALSDSGENLVQTFQRVTGEFRTTNSVATMLGKDSAGAFGAVGIASEGARKALIDAAGGMDALTQKSASYYQLYYSDSERQAASLKVSQIGVADAFSALNLAIPDTEAGFRALVESQDLSTASGRNTYLALIDVATAFKAVSTAGWGAVQATKAMAANPTSTVAANDSYRATYDNAVANHWSMDEAAANTGYSKSQIAAYLAENNLPSFDVGSPLVPRDMVAQIHRDEGIVDAPSWSILRKYGIPVTVSGGGSNDELLAEMRQLRSDLNAALATISAASSKTAKTLDAAANGGQPLGIVAA